ncbi:MAG: antitoxin Xre-like helix-turn-helix domain-containing protein [Gammaproteobacteria bacterium]
MSARTESPPDAAAVLAKAVLRAADQLGLKQGELARTLGVHRTAISRLKQSAALDPASKTGELALLLIRIARSLSALTGGDEAWIRHFMRTPNRLSGGVPVEQLGTIQGLVTLLQLVDALRGRA